MHGDFEYFAWSEKINRRYCERHGYSYVARRNPGRTDRHINWQKIPDIIAELQDCDYLLSLDADAFFYAQELKIEEELIPLMGDKHVLMAQDFGSEQERWTPGFPNAGVILMKATGQVKRFLADWDQSSEIDDKYKWEWPLEQRSLWEVVLPGHQEIVHIEMDYYRIQARYGYSIRHCFRQDDATRTQAMKQYYETYLNLSPLSGIKRNPMNESQKKPGYFGMAYHYTRALSRWIKAGRPVRNEAEIKRIFETFCSPCEAHDMESSSCRYCGCRVNLKESALTNKIAMATEDCPIGRWQTPESH